MHSALRAGRQRTLRLTAGRPTPRLPPRSTDGAPEEDRVAEEKKETWTQWVALTTTILAVCAAISSLKGGGYSTKVQLATTRENDHWAQYQAKSIKGNLFVVERDLFEVLALEARSPAAKQLIEARKEKLTAEVARYEREKTTLREEAEGIQKDEADFQRHGANFGLAVMLLQIAIMLSSVGALIKRPAMWVVGLVFGAAGLAYMARGFGLF
jgi:hypothetical protein